MLAHLLGDGWHVADLLLYGGASVGLVGGFGLFLWGRREHRASPPPQSPEAVQARQEPLVKRG
jgi:hypothetical protein